MNRESEYLAKLRELRQEYRDVAVANVAFVRSDLLNAVEDEISPEVEHTFFVYAQQEFFKWGESLLVEHGWDVIAEIARTMHMSGETE